MIWVHHIVLIFSLILGTSPVHAQAPVPVPEVIPLDVQSVLQSAPTSFTPYYLDATTTALVDLTNDNRVNGVNGIAPVTMVNLDHALMKAAYLRAEFFCGNTFVHFGPDGSTPWMFFHGVGYEYKDAGENLANGYSSPQEMQQAFVNSPDHLANIMNPKFTDMGVADMCGHVVVLFGDR